jgi:hypothetical protein
MADEMQTIVGSKRLLKNANWARYNLAVSVRKENEPSSSSMFNMNLPGKPMVDFHEFFDGENMTQTDLVAWINVGTHHLVGPHFLAKDSMLISFLHSPKPKIRPTHAPTQPPQASSLPH